MTWKVVVFAVAMVGALTSSAQVTTGTISGTVSDTTGAVLPGAKLVIQNEDTGISRTVATDAAGRYLAPQLGLGNYRVTASMEGFQTRLQEPGTTEMERKTSCGLIVSQQRRILARGESTCRV